MIALATMAVRPRTFTKPAGGFEAGLRARFPEGRFVARIQGREIEVVFAPPVAPAKKKP